jgi:hypothetical protein
MPATQLHPANIEARIEVLNDAHQALLRNSFDADPRAYIRATNVLLDACVDAGMSHEEPDHEGWAAERVTRWLVEA